MNSATKTDEIKSNTAIIDAITVDTGMSTAEADAALTAVLTAIRRTLTEAAADHHMGRVVCWLEGFGAFGLQNQAGHPTRDENGQPVNDPEWGAVPWFAADTELIVAARRAAGQSTERPPRLI
ncbi:HU family DNA-binding protein [Streptosporangium saharense]|uniref:Nucleoid DNA-binding protein n=1 Tax=Streptosporangium saharense TaxID=1706840 RepID=A0A7W7VK48_9ACTN|nr:hypothetical protein [Streptosporangium saharense]MBB4913332.1 nucleoid DNA-binding protein [Streptosporangium saharense]